MEPRLDMAMCTEEYNVYHLGEPFAGAYPPVYLPRRYSELTFTALGRDARELLFSAYDGVTCDYVVVEMVRSVDLVGGAWLLTNRELVALLLRTRLRHQTVLRVLGVWTPATCMAEFRSFFVAYESARQQLSYYLVPYMLLRLRMPHWRLSNMLYQIAWAAHHLHCYEVRLNNVWDVPLTCFMYDDDASAIKVNVKLLLTAVKRSVRRREDESAALRGLGRMLVRHLLANAFGSLDVNAKVFTQPEFVIDLLLSDMRFSCDDDCGDQRFVLWSESAASAGCYSLDAQTSLLKNFLLRLLTDGVSARPNDKFCSSDIVDEPLTFSSILTHPYVRAWHEEDDFDYHFDPNLVSDLERIRLHCSSGVTNGYGRSLTGSDECWEVPLHSIMSESNRRVMFQEIKRFEHSHPHSVRPLSVLCSYCIVIRSQCSQDFTNLPVPYAVSSKLCAMRDGLQ